MYVSPGSATQVAVRLLLTIATSSTCCPAVVMALKPSGKPVSSSGSCTEKEEPTFSPLSARKGIEMRSVSYGEMAIEALVDAEVTVPR